MLNQKTQYLTPKGLADLQNELEYLKNTKIPEIAVRIDEAKQHGDLSENAEYHQAKEEMAWAQGRKQDVQHILDNAEIVESAGQDQGGKVQMGSNITVKTGDRTKSYTIVGPQEADPLQGKISNESPLGGTFIGRAVGDEVSVVTPAGKQIYEILEIK